MPGQSAWGSLARTLSHRASPAGLEPHGIETVQMQRNLDRRGFVPPDAAYVCTEHAARYLSLSRRTLEDYRYRGIGPRLIRRGRVVRYAIADLDEWMRGGGARQSSAGAA